MVVSFPSGPAIIVSSSDQYMAFKQLTLEKISHEVSTLSSRSY